MLISEKEAVEEYKQKLLRKVALQRELQSESTLYHVMNGGDDAEELREVDAAIIALERALRLDDAAKERYANECGLVIIKKV